VKVLVLLAKADAAALEVALALGKDETVALRAGPPEEEPLLHAAAAAGASRVVRLWDPVLADIDYLGLATALSAAARTLGCALVVAGDRGEGAVGPAAAEGLDVPHLTGVLSAELTGQSLQVRRLTLAGIQTLRGPASAVLCVVPRSLDPLPPSAPACAVEVLGLADVGLTPEQLQHRRRLCVVQEGAPERPSPRRFASAAELIARLREDGLLVRR
jgi:electron transfer flavoprotein alpha/beta subunit